MVDRWSKHVNINDACSKAQLHLIMFNDISSKVSDDPSPPMAWNWVSGLQSKFKLFLLGGPQTDISASYHRTVASYLSNSSSHVALAKLRARSMSKGGLYSPSQARLVRCLADPIDVQQTHDRLQRQKFSTGTRDERCGASVHRCPSD